MATFVVFFFFLLCGVHVEALPESIVDQWDAMPSSQLHRAKRDDPIPDTQRDCTDPDHPKYPNTVTETATRLEDLRVEMRDIDVQAYIIPSEDAHNSEYIAECHKRREWITGFTGSAGLAIVTDDDAALWIDGRYDLQAEQQLDCNWLAMQTSQLDTAKQWDWLIEVLPAGDENNPTKVGFDPTLLSLSTYNNYANAFKASTKYIEMYAYSEANLVDEVWSDRPDCTNEPLFILDSKWTGQDWWDKIEEIREDKMEPVGADMMVLHALDDTAWLFNMRGSDIPYKTVFFSYTILTPTKTTLFVKNKEDLIVDEISNHLLQNGGGHCSSQQNNHKCLVILEYDDFLDELYTMAHSQEVTKVWISTSASYGIYGNINESKQYSAAIPIQKMKAVKNPAEVAGMKEGYIQDAVAMVEFLHWIEGEVVVANGDKEKLSELSADVNLREFREKQEDFVMPSFGTISAFGPHGAVIHYKSTNETNVAITDKDLYLLDSGGQYKCGATTDTTRTMHFGIPADRHKEAYTRVLMGSIDISQCVFISGTGGKHIDALARQHLWNNGWNYNHGTGHGVGAMLNVHEGPFSLSSTLALEPNVFLSDEPGYYEDNDYGVRLETVFTVVEVDTPNNFGGAQFLTFEEISFVPFHPKLIKYDLMTSKQISWLNDYNDKIRTIIGPRVKEINPEAYDWMMKQTNPVTFSESPVNCAHSPLNTETLVLSVMLSVILFKYMS